MCHIYTREYYLATTKDKSLTHNMDKSDEINTGLKNMKEHTLYIPIYTECKAHKINM